MSLCSLCISIPFEDLPNLSPSYFPGSSEWKYIHAFYNSPMLNKSGQPIGSSQPLGYPYHPNINALRASASNCQLCDLVLTVVEKVISERNRATQEQMTKFNNFPAVLSLELWLTKRRDMGDGFWVFSTSGDENIIYLVAAVGLCVREGDPLASSFIGRPIEEHSESQTTMDRAVGWVNQCNEHQECSASLLHPLPARVIDIGEAAGSSSIRLHETNGEPGTYMTLSYCWGSSRHFTTTRSSIEARKKGIDFNEIPKTFQDAIVVARALKVRYIWIDSLCICQDDLEDWQRESAKMASVYKNSYLTIAATRSSNSSIGCFGARSAKRYIPMPHTTRGGTKGQFLAFLLPLREEAVEGYIGMETEPLSQRAWALQERVLAPRILHYGKHQMYFECNRGFISENGLRFTYRYNDLHGSTDDRLMSYTNKKEGDNNPNPILDQWFELLHAYGLRQLTKPSDKLPALSGLAQVYGERLNDTYVAGLWRNSLLECLLWEGLRGSRHDLEYRAPSWSWASFNGITAFGPSGNWDFIAEIIDVQIELGGLNNYGEVKSGWIELRAPLVPIFLNELSENEGEGVPYERNPKVRTEKGDPRGQYSRFDIDFVNMTRQDTVALIQGFENVELFALVIAKTFKTGAADEKRGYHSLIVAKSEDGGGSMRRLGFLNLDDEMLGSCTALENVEERPVVTFV